MFSFEFKTHVLNAPLKVSMVCFRSNGFEFTGFQMSMFSHKESNFHLWILWTLSCHKTQVLTIFWSRIDISPERILWMSKLPLSGIYWGQTTDSCRNNTFPGGQITYMHLYFHCSLPLACFWSRDGQQLSLGADFSI